MSTRKRYWMMKSEPDAFSIDDLERIGTEPWNGVRNYQARNFMKAMRPGDLGFFYHSNGEKAVVGVVEVAAPAHPDSSTEDPRWECVDIRAVAPMPRPVTLAEIKATPELAGMVLVKNSRLSVQPVGDDEWAIVCRMGGYPG